MSVPGPASLWFRWVYLDVLQIKTKLSLTACMYDPNNLQLQISSSSMGGCDPWRYRHTIKNHIIVFKRTHIDRPHQTPATATKRERERDRCTQRPPGHYLYAWTSNQACILQDRLGLHTRSTQSGGTLIERAPLACKQRKEQFVSLTSRRGSHDFFFFFF